MRFLKYFIAWLLLIGGILLIDGLVGSLLGAWRTIPSFFLGLGNAITTAAPLGLTILLPLVLATIIFIAFVAFVEFLSQKTSVLPTPSSSETQENEKKDTTTQMQNLNSTDSPHPTAVDAQTTISQSEITTSSTTTSTPSFQSPIRITVTGESTTPVQHHDYFNRTPTKVSNATLLLMPIISSPDSPKNVTTTNVTTPCTTDDSGKSTTPIPHHKELSATSIPIISSPGPRRATSPANNFSTPSSNATPDNGGSTTPIQHHDAPTATTDNGGSTTPIQHHDVAATTPAVTM